MALVLAGFSPTADSFLHVLREAVGLYLCASAAIAVLGVAVAFQAHRAGQGSGWAQLGIAASLLVADLLMAVSLTPPPARLGGLLLHAPLPAPVHITLLVVLVLGRRRPAAPDEAAMRSEEP